MPIVLVPSLVHLASVKVSFELFIYSRHRISLEILHSQQFQDPETWEQCWRETIHYLLRTLILPPCLNQGLRKMIRPMGEEILDWKAEMFSIHKECARVIDMDCRCIYPEISNFIDFYGCPCVNSIGCIDEKKSAQILVENPMLDNPFRFVLACMYCFESNVISIWQRLSTRQKRLFSAQKDSILVPMVGYWVDILEDAEATFLTMLPPFQPPHIEEYQNNPAVLHYVLGKLPPEERQDHVKTIALGSIMDTKLLRACLIQMDRDQLLEFLTIHPERVLLCFLQWPWQCIFLKVIDMMWEFLNEDHYYNIMQYILSSKISQEMDDYDYVGLLRDIWQCTPRHLKAYVQYFFQNDPTWHTIIL